MPSDSIGSSEQSGLRAWEKRHPFAVQTIVVATVGVLGFFLFVAMFSCIIGDEPQVGRGSNARTASVDRATPTPEVDLDLRAQLAVDQMEEYAGVMDAAVRLEGRNVSLVLVVYPAVGPGLAEELGDTFVRVSKSLLNDGASGKQIGRGKYDYLIGVYWPGGDDPIVLGAKSRAAENIRW